jgi:hypothetical protein
MSKNWKITMAATFLAIALTSSPIAAAAAEAAKGAAIQDQSLTAFVKLTDRVQAELKSVFSEESADGSVIGAVIRLKNTSSVLTRVPDYELRMSSSDGAVYTFIPSAANPRAIQPKEKVELSYLIQVNRTDKMELTKISWIHVDEYVYPRKENVLLTMDVTDRIWSSQDLGEKSDSLPGVKWGQPFQLKMFTTDLSYTPVGIQRQLTPRGEYATVIELKAANTGKNKVYIPDFVISGSDGTTLYAGEKADGQTAALGAGESKHIRFAIPTAAAVRISELFVTTPELFVASSGSRIIHQVGHLKIDLPIGNAFLAGWKDYSYGTPIAIDPLSEGIDKDIQISLVELHMHDNQGDGYKTAIAKFKLQNTGKQPTSLPAFQAELTNEEGYTYAGDRQNAALQKLMPGLSHVVSYAFNVPKTEDSDRFALQILDGGTAEAPYSSSIATIGVHVQTEADEKVWNLYPFNVAMKSWSLSAVADAIPVMSYSYKLILDLDIAHTEDVVVDAGFSKLKIEIADSFGKMLGSETIPFVGVNRLISGKQTIRFNNIRTEQHQYPLTIHLYEVIDTPSGEATRLIQTLKQR